MSDQTNGAHRMRAPQIRAGIAEAQHQSDLFIANADGRRPEEGSAPNPEGQHGGGTGDRGPNWSNGDTRWPSRPPVLAAGPLRGSMHRGTGARAAQPGDSAGEELVGRDTARGGDLALRPGVSYHLGTALPCIGMAGWARVAGTPGPPLVLEPRALRPIGVRLSKPRSGAPAAYGRPIAFSGPWSGAARGGAPRWSTTLAPPPIAMRARHPKKFGC